MRAAGLIVILGIVAAGIWSVGAAPLACCGPDCPQCPTVLCKPASDFTVSTPPALPGWTPVAFRILTYPRLGDALRQPCSIHTRIDGPMRN